MSEARATAWAKDMRASIRARVEGEVLREVGYESDAIERLEADAVIKVHRPAASDGAGDA